MEDRPQLAEVVFHGRAGQAQALLGLQLADGEGGLAGAAFDVLRLIEHQYVPVLRTQVFEVAGGEGVGGEHQVVIVQRGEMLAAPWAMQCQDAQVGGKAFSLVEPVRYQAGRHHGQGRGGQAPGLFFEQQMGQGLQGLAQAHVVAEDTAGAHFAQGLHPVQALLLIRAQGGIQLLGRFDLQVARIAQAFAQVAHMRAAFPVQG
ncbi:hypothetical protein D3C81_819670 [compost metagenome]